MNNLVRFFKQNLFYLILSALILTGLGGGWFYANELKNQYKEQVRQERELLSLFEERIMELPENPIKVRYGNFQMVIIEKLFGKELEEELAVSEEFNDIIQVQDALSDIYALNIFEFPAKDNYIKENVSDDTLNHLKELMDRLNNNRLRERYMIYYSIASIQKWHMDNTKKSYDEYLSDGSKLSQFVLDLSKIKNPELKEHYASLVNVEVRQDFQSLFEQLAADATSYEQENNTSTFATELAELKAKEEEKKKTYEELTRSNRTSSSSSSRSSSSISSSSSWSSISNSSSNQDGSETVTEAGDE